MGRRPAILGVAIFLCMVAILAVVLANSSSDQTDGLSRKKIAELAAFGVTPQQYLRARRRGEEHEAALRSAPPADPNVVGPRLIREQRESELLAWKEFYDKRLHAKVIEEWHTHQLNQTRTIISLDFVLKNKRRILGPAEWMISIALERPLTPAEERLVNNGDAIQPLNHAARLLETFPKPA